MSEKVKKIMTLLKTKCGCVITRNSKEHDECRCDDDGENWICADCYNGEYDEEEEEIQPHCYKCFNMNMSMNVNCFVCDKLYCKSHSYCILGDDDMPYCSKECFLNC